MAARKRAAQPSSPDVAAKCWEADPVLCLQAIPGEAYRMLDKGPAPDSPEAAAFRAFWGDKAELRRFQASRIVCSCCVHMAVPCSSCHAGWLAAGFMSALPNVTIVAAASHEL